jgi:hypothetical protein
MYFPLPSALNFGLQSSGAEAEHDQNVKRCVKVVSIAFVLCSESESLPAPQVETFSCSGMLRSYG